MNAQVLSLEAARTKQAVAHLAESVRPFFEAPGIAVSGLRFWFEYVQAMTAIHVSLLQAATNTGEQR